MKDINYLSHSPAAQQWEKIGIRHHHGFAIPLFSIHSKNSYGIGEYTDLPLLFDFCATVGFDLVQLLPLNDCGLWHSPYSALSAFALDPIFLGLNALPFVNEEPLLAEELKAIPKFSQTQRVDYVRVRSLKEQFLKHYYDIFGSKILASESYLDFFSQASYWLKGYAAYKIFKEKNLGMNWEDWPENEQIPNQELLKSLEEHKDFPLFCVLQYLCDTQLRDAKNYGSKKNILLMGDIPILISRDSADVWLHQEMFDFSYSAGAPPDYYSDEGQKWGFPIYRWEALEAQDYLWWKERLKWAARYYDIYRIDHVVGFFRIWSIPIDQPPKLGHFIPEDEKTWINHGQCILMMMLNNCPLLPIGEDLGVIPPEVRECLSALGICGTKVMRWERNWLSDKQYIFPQNYPFDSLTTVSIHDSETLQQWWKRSPIEAQLYSNFKGWSYQPTLGREYHREILWDSHHSGSLFHINLLQEYFPLLPGLSWPDPDDERINVPGTITDTNWTYRLKLSLEELAQQSSLIHLMRELIK